MLQPYWRIPSEMTVEFDLLTNTFPLLESLLTKHKSASPLRMPTQKPLNLQHRISCLIYPYQLLLLTGTADWYCRLPPLTSTSSWQGSRRRRRQWRRAIQPISQANGREYLQTNEPLSRSFLQIWRRLRAVCDKTNEASPENRDVAHQACLVDKTE